MASVGQIALRVSQLDAGELDAELFSLLKNQFSTAFKYFKPGLLAKYNPEINAVLRFLIWRFTFFVDHHTTGQRLLNLKYVRPSKWLSPRQIFLHGIFTILLPWLRDRLGDLGSENSHHKVWKILGILESLHQMAALVNFLAFLRGGQYTGLTERVLGLRQVFRSPQGVRQAGFEYMDREILWHGFAEFLFFFLPLINIRRVKNALKQLMGTQTVKDYRDQSDHTAVIRCAECDALPTNPHTMGCAHSFCYFCLKGNILVDPRYSCPLCGHTVTDVNSIQPAIVTDLKS